MLTEMIKGKSIAECRELTVEDLIAALDGVPPDKLHYPAPAIGAFKDVLCTGLVRRRNRLERTDDGGSVVGRG